MPYSRVERRRFSSRSACRAARRLRVASGLAAFLAAFPWYAMQPGERRRFARRSAKPQHPRVAVPASKRRSRLYFQSMPVL
jgi:hypothetical protein